MIRTGAAGLLATLLAACSPPAILNGLDRLSGRPGGAVRVATGVPFGTHGQRLDVWARRGPGPRRRPVLVFWHGGGWTSGTRQAYGFVGRAFAARGFVVVIPDYRKVPAARYPAFVVDAADAVRWTRDHVAELGGDPGRIALAGHSAGAYAAVTLALDTRWLRAAGVDPGVVRAGLGISGPYDFHPFTSPLAARAFAGAADGPATQPVNHVRADAPPLLLMTSDRDTLVEPRNAEALAARLRAVGAPVVLRRYPGIGHAGTVMALARPFRGKAPVLDEATAFLEDALRDQRDAVSGMSRQ